jgi:hypothetical protein
MKIGKIFYRILLYLAALLTIGLLVRAIFNYQMGIKLGDYIGNRQDEGVAFSRKALMPDCRDEDNGANLWRAAEALFSRESLNVKLVRDATKSLFYDKSLGHDVREELNGVIEKNARVFQFMQEASEKPCFQYGDWIQRLYDMRIPDAVKMLNAIRLVGIDAVFKSEGGKTQEAIDQIRWATRLVKRTMDEPLTITGLIAIANFKHLLLCLNRITEGKDIDSETLRDLIQDLDPERWRHKFARHIQGERVYFVELAFDVLEGDPAVFNLNLSESLFFWLIRPITKAETRWALKKYEDVEFISLLPFYKTKESQKEYLQDIESLPWYFYVSKTFLPKFDAVWLKEANLEAVMGAGQIGLACKIFKNEEGHFPVDITSLVPGILANEPVDPFTGKSFVYALREDGFIVYSLGSNEKDDEGRGTFEITKLIMEKDDDLSWREKIK